VLVRTGRRAALVIALVVGAVVTLSPANGAASDIAKGFARTVRHLAVPSRDGQAFAGTPAVGALFTYGTWTVTRVYVDQAWKSSSSDDDDVAFLRVGQPGSSVPVQDVTGAERLATGTPVSRQLVQVIGYPNATNQPVTCQNWLRQPMAGQLEFDCGGYTNGTSGGPFLSEVDQATGQGLVIGVIGGYQQGGDTPQVSYSAVLGANAAALYKRAVAGG
jgi:hypothetical protein